MPGKILVVGLSLLGTAVLAGAAQARPSVTPSTSVEVTRSSSVNASARLFSTEKLTTDTYRLSEWYVAVNRDSLNGLYAEVTRQDELCHRSTLDEDDDCQPEKTMGGRSSHSSVKLDRRLRAAALDATLDLQATDPEGHEIGGANRMDLVVLWRGSGRRSLMRDTFTHRDACRFERGVTLTRKRFAKVHATVDDQKLDDGQDAWLSATRSRTVTGGTC